MKIFEFTETIETRPRAVAPSRPPRQVAGDLNRRCNAPLRLSEALKARLGPRSGQIRILRLN